MEVEALMETSGGVVRNGTGGDEDGMSNQKGNDISNDWADVDSLLLLHQQMGVEPPAV